MSKLLVFTLVVGALLLAFTVTARADGPSSCTYTGNVRLDNAEVADGTLITAVIAGDEYHTHTSTGYGYSTYSLTIRAPDGTNYPDGIEVTFKVKGHPTGETAVFQAGASVRLDLTASTASVLSPSRIALVSGLVVAFLAAIVAAYFFLVRHRGIRIVDRLRGKGGVPSRQAPPLAVEGQVQPVSRYTWDNTKLAWVQNPEPAKSKSRKRGQDTSITVDARKEAVAPQQAAPTSAERREQPISGYTWDSAKLAWVEKAEPATSKSRIGESVTSGMRDGAPVVGSPGVARQRGQDTSIMVDARKEAVAPERALPTAVGSNGQPISRYVWDSAKLAWVENTEPVNIKPQIGPPATSATRFNIPVVVSAGTARQMEKDASILVTSQSEAVAQKEPVVLTGKKAAELYDGSVRLLVTSPSGLGQVRKFIANLRGLRRSYMIGIRSARVSSRQSVAFELFLDRPTPLLEVLKRLPEVDTIVTRLNSPVEVKLL
jgi:hypothetical protein